MKTINEPRELATSFCCGVSSKVEHRVHSPSTAQSADTNQPNPEECILPDNDCLDKPLDVECRHTHETGGSIPSPRPISKIKRFQLRVKEPLGRKECPYAYRWTLNFWLFSIRVHQWIRSDDKRYFHDHPWHFITLVLKGGYTDVSLSGRDVLSAGNIRFRHALHQHYVEVPPGGAWTILLTSMPVRNWGFWVKGRLKRPLRYFGKFGHPPCHEQ